MTINSFAQTFNDSEINDKVIAGCKAASLDSFKSLLIDSVDYREALSYYVKDIHISVDQKKLNIEKGKQFADSSIMSVVKNLTD